MTKAWSLQGLQIQCVFYASLAPSQSHFPSASLIRSAIFATAVFVSKANWVWNQVFFFFRKDTSATIAGLSISIFPGSSSERGIGTWRYVFGLIRCYFLMPYFNFWISLTPSFARIMLMVPIHWVKRCFWFFGVLSGGNDGSGCCEATGRSTKNSWHFSDPTVTEYICAIVYIDVYNIVYCI